MGAVVIGTCWLCCFSGWMDGYSRLMDCVVEVSCVVYCLVGCRLSGVE